MSLKLAKVARASAPAKAAKANDLPRSYLPPVLSYKLWIISVPVPHASQRQDVVKISDDRDGVAAPRAPRAR